MKRTIELEGRVGVGLRVCCRVPIERVVERLPAGLEPVRRGGYGFVEIACQRVEHLRPAGLPEPIGVGFNQAAYRLHVQAMTDRAEVVRGLYTLRTDCDAALLGRLGNRLTGMNFCDAAVAIDEDDCHVAVKTARDRHSEAGKGGETGLDLAVTHMPAALLPGSCFPTVADARDYCGYRPLLLDVERDGALTRVEAARVGPCCETPVAIARARWGYFEALGLADVMEPEWAVRVSAVAMRWRVGGSEALLGSARQERAARDAARRPLRVGVAADQPEAVRV